MEALQANVERLNAYKSKLVVFPKSGKAEEATQFQGVFMPVEKVAPKVEFVAVSDAMKKNSAVNIEESPVRPPSATPAEDSTKVVTVEVPQTAPVVVAIASASIALSMFGTSPSLVSILPRAHAP